VVGQPDHQRARTPTRDEIRPSASITDDYAAGDELLGGGDVVVGGGDVVVGGGDVVVGGGDVVVGGGDGCVIVGVGVGELLCCGVGVGEGDLVGVLFEGDCIAARLLVALLVVADGAGLLVLEPAPEPPLLRGFAPVGLADWLGAGAPPALWIVPE
jgi:hypothetical protein